jgi:hypothetical protein
MCTIPLVRIRHHDGNDSKNKLRLALGEVEVLKYALKHHNAALNYREQLIQAIHQRRDEVFYKAFRNGNFSVAGAVFPLLENRPRSFIFKIKRAVLKFHSIFYNYDLRTSLNLSVPSETAGAVRQFDSHSHP